MERFSERGGWWVVGQAALLAACAGSWVFWHADWGLGAVLAGVALTASGATMGIWAGVALGKALTPYPSPVPDSRFVGKGPYRLVRHPIYGGVVMGVVGVSLAFGSLPALGVCAVLVGFFILKARSEEVRLGARYPEYAGYRERVRRRLVPWVV
jgi:protein-S-isoprenylcysteine O-methyltransferase Ste14